MHFFKFMYKNQYMKIKFCFLKIIFFNELFSLLFNLLFFTKEHYLHDKIFSFKKNYS